MSDTRKCTVGDFKKMIEVMNIPDDAEIHGVSVVYDYITSATFSPIDFSYTTYDNGTIAPVEVEVFENRYNKTVIRIGEN